jgi:hypothetical protein
MWAVWRGRALPTPKTEERMPKVFGQQLLRAWEAVEHLQGMRWQQHLPAWKAQVSL